MEEIICPNCKNLTYDPEALLCHFCGESLQRAGSGFLSNLRYSNFKIIWIMLTLIVLLSFAFLMVF